MMLNPEQFGLDAAAAPWARARQMASHAMGPMGVVRPIIALMEQSQADRTAVFQGQRIDVRKAPSPMGMHAAVLPDLPPGAGRGR